MEYTNISHTVGILEWKSLKSSSVKFFSFNFGCILAVAFIVHNVQNTIGTILVENNVQRNDLN